MKVWKRSCLRAASFLILAAARNSKNSNNSNITKGIIAIMAIIVVILIIIIVILAIILVVSVVGSELLKLRFATDRALGIARLRAGCLRRVLAGLPVH